MPNREGHRRFGNVRKHIEPHLGGVQVGKVSPRMIREWRAALLASWRVRLGDGQGLSVASRHLDDCGGRRQSPPPQSVPDPRRRDRGADERPVLTVAQVFELAEHAGRRPVGNIRKIPGGYRLRFCRHGEMRTSPESL
jgi:hypothetical protein